MTKPKIDIYDKHSHMVSQLAKPGEAIIADLTSETAHIWHMATGLAGESVEVDCCLRNLVLSYGCDDSELLCNDMNHFMKELGDYEFYLRALCDAFCVTTFKDGAHLSINTQDTQGSLLEKSCALLEKIKKFAVYKRQDEDFVKELKDDLYGLTNITMPLLYEAYDLNREDVLQMNYDKLHKRYSKGTYSNKQAIDRKDVK